MLLSDSVYPSERPVIERKQPKVASGKFRYLYGGGALPERVVRPRPPCGGGAQTDSTNG